MSERYLNPDDFNLNFGQTATLDFVWEIKYKGVVIDQSPSPCSYEAMMDRWSRTMEASKTLH